MTVNPAKPTPVYKKEPLGKRLAVDFQKHKYKYLLILPIIIYLILFCYKPMYGLVIAFKQYRPTRGIWNSKWVGFLWFETFFKDPYFWRLLRNTFSISGLSILFGFPAPILLALLLNEVHNNKFKRTVQTITYMPYFISLVVTCSLMCWQMYLATQDVFYRDEAVRTEAMLDEGFKNYRVLSHDNGFMWLIHSGVRFALEHNKDSFDRTLFAAKRLACRYNPNGFIRAWQGRGREGWAIVDCLMNLPMLYWATDVTGDPRYKLMAMKHADTAMEAFIRPDGSSNHIVIFDPMTGEVLDNPAGQGYASGSCWSRGLSWAVYGFTLSYMATGKQAYLDTAKVQFTRDYTG